MCIRDRNKQVEEITDGAIPARAMGTALSAGVAISLGIAMLRVLTGISILWILIPGYTIALVISFFAVSYTPLDVYKRQTVLCRKI